MAEKEALINMHEHGFETGEHDKADITAREFLALHTTLAQIMDVQIVTNCGSHDSTAWAREVWKLYKEYPGLEEHVKLYPQSEFTVDIGHVLTYHDDELGDDKFVFKKMHLLAAAKKGREEEYFKKTEIYSAWADMFIKKDISKGLVNVGEHPARADDNSFINVGEMMLAARNVLCEKYCKNQDDRIPYEVYTDTIEPGLTYNEIRRRFIDDTYKYLSSKGLISGTPEEAKAQIEKDITRIETYTPTKKVSDFVDSVEDKLERKFFKNHGRKFPEHLFDEARKPGLTVDEAADIVKRKTEEYFLANRIGHSPVKVERMIDEQANAARKVGRTFIFPEITADQILQARAGRDQDKIFPRLGDGAFVRLNPKDIKILFGDTAYFCLAHPNEEDIRKDTKLPVSVFDGVDISSLPKEVQKTINDRLEEYRKTGKETYFSVDDDNPVLVRRVGREGKESTEIKGDVYGVVKDEILIRALDAYGKQYGFNIDGVELSKRMFMETDSGKNLHSENAWAHYDLYVKYDKAINCNSAIGDIHLKHRKDLALIDDAMSRAPNQRCFHDDLTFTCTQCTWVDLLENGTFDVETQGVSVRVKKEYLNKHYRPVETEEM